MPKISVITPALIDGHEKLDWLEEALQSALDQTFTDWEMIIVDDFSPISLDALKNQFNSPKFRWFRTPKRSGPALCRNVAVELSEHKQAILPLDADDLFANENVLDIMYREWSRDPSKFYYGNLIKRVERQEDKEYALPDYTFAKSLDAQKGLVPVTAIHSYECWRAAGGWKPMFDAGREDVEYWISAGKAGFCGQRVNTATLVYRKHSIGRDYALLNINRRVSEMINKIRNYHADVYKGKYPMGCCPGSQSGYIPPTEPRAVSAPSTLAGYSDDQKIWVEYAGRNTGGFGVNGQFTHYSYRINGPGHLFQIHIQDKSRFAMAGRGTDFKIDVAPPSDYAAPGPEEPAAYVAPDPELAIIEQLDEVAAGFGSH